MIFGIMFLGPTTLSVEIALAVKVFQILFRETQRSELDPVFEAFDNSASQDRAWCEYGVFTRRAPLHRDSSDYAGYVSWRFGRKTGLTGHQVLDFIEKHPGFDVYYVNPYPLGSFYQNIWHQFECNHPGIAEIAQYLLDERGLGIDLATWVQPEEDISFCNYWIGNGRFWSEYMDFSGPIRDRIEVGLPPRLASILERVQKYGLTMRPFLMEGIFSTYLSWSRGLGANAMRRQRIPAPRIAFDPSLDAAMRELKAFTLARPDVSPARLYASLHKFLSEVETNTLAVGSPMRILTDRKLKLAQRLLQRAEVVRPLYVRIRTQFRRLLGSDT